MVLTLREQSRRRLPLGRRDSQGLNAWHRTKMASTLRNVELLARAHEGLKKIPRARSLLKEVKKTLLEEVVDLLRVMVVDVPDDRVRVKAEPMTFAKMQAELDRMHIECSTRFRFQSFEHLSRLIVGFQFPAGRIMLTPGRGGHSSTAEEILLVSLSSLLPKSLV